MKRIDSFSLQPAAKPAKHELCRSSLSFNGQPRPTVLQGSVLEAQFLVGEHYLLLLTDDSPYEEGLHIYLLDAQLQIVDDVEMGQPYAPGQVKELHIVAPDQLEFSFFGNERWRLQVLNESKRLRIGPFLPQVRINSRRLLSKRYLKLTLDSLVAFICVAIVRITPKCLRAIPRIPIPAVH